MNSAECFVFYTVKNTVKLWQLLGSILMLECRKKVKVM